MQVIPVVKTVILSLVPKGFEGCAAVMPSGSKRSPEAVRDPLSDPYQEAMPVSSALRLLHARATSETAIAMAARHRAFIHTGLFGLSTFGGLHKKAAPNGTALTADILGRACLLTSERVHAGLRLFLPVSVDILRPDCRLAFWLRSAFSQVARL